MSGIVWVIYLLILVAIIAGWWMLFEKAGEAGWKSIIPIWNVLIILKIVGREWWWIILFLIPIVGFLPATDPRVRGTLEAVRRTLLSDCFVRRYEHDEGVASVDGLPPGEGAFFLCSFWFVDNLILLGELEEAMTMFDRLLSLRSELGLLAEEYDPELGRLVGNFPQAFSHIGLVNTALLLDKALNSR